MIFGLTPQNSIIIEKKGQTIDWQYVGIKTKRYLFPRSPSHSSEKSVLCEQIESCLGTLNA